MATCAAAEACTRIIRIRCCVLLAEQHCAALLGSLRWMAFLSCRFLVILCCVCVLYPLPYYYALRTQHSLPPALSIPIIILALKSLDEHVSREITCRPEQTYQKDKIKIQKKIK